MVRTEQETATSVELQLDSLRQKADLEKLRYQESDIGYRIGYFVSVAFWLGYVFFSFWYAPGVWYNPVVIFVGVSLWAKVIIHVLRRSFGHKVPWGYTQRNVTRQIELVSIVS